MSKDEMSDEMKALFGEKEKHEEAEAKRESGKTQSSVKEPGPEIPRAAIVSPDKLKAVFDKMTEIETNPNSRTAREFEQKMMEMEKKNSNRRQGQIMIKTMRKGRIRNV